MEDLKLATETTPVGPKADEAFDPYSHPYMRIPEAERQRAPGHRTDLRKLSAWIKMMRELEEAKQRRED
jgi:hypothetical protein